MKEPTSCCPHCDGTGRIALTGILADTLALLRTVPQAWGTVLAKVDGCEPTAMNNRLSILERKGLATSVRYGRLRLFRALDLEGEE